MPCNTIQTATIKLDKAQPELLKAALAAMGITSYNFQSGVLSLRGMTMTPKLEAQIKQNYSKQVVLSQAKKFGWQVKETSPFQFNVIKR